MLIMRFIYAFQKHTAGFGGDHVNIVAPASAEGLGIEEYAIASLGNVPVDVSLRERRCQIDGRTHEGFSLVCPTERIHAQGLIILNGVIHQESRIGSRPQNIYVLLNDLPLAQVGILLFDQTVGVACREFLIIQNPDLHIPLFALSQDHIHIGPPVGTAKIRVRTGFYTHRATSALINSLYLSGNTIAVSAVLPIKGE